MNNNKNEFILLTNKSALDFHHKFIEIHN